jgi:hypothetical protein
MASIESLGCRTNQIKCWQCAPTENEQKKMELTESALRDFHAATGDDEKVVTARPLPDDVRSRRVEFLSNGRTEEKKRNEKKCLN